MEHHKLAHQLVQTAHAVGIASAQVEGLELDHLRSLINMESWRLEMPVFTRWQAGRLEVLRMSFKLHLNTEERTNRAAAQYAKGFDLDEYRARAEAFKAGAEWARKNLAI